MKILVTGGSGFIGSHLVDELVIKGHEVINIDNCSANNEKFYFNKLAANHKIDVCDFNAVQQISQGCDFVFHLACLGVRHSHIYL